MTKLPCKWIRLDREGLRELSEYERSGTGTEVRGEGAFQVIDQPTNTFTFMLEGSSQVAGRALKW